MAMLCLLIGASDLCDTSFQAYKLTSFFHLLSLSLTSPMAR
jgi:hypothetical protein